MKVGFWGIFFLVVAGSLAFGSDDLIKSDMEQLQGKWKLMAIEMRGRICDDEDVLMDHSLQVTGDKWTMKRGDKILAEATFKIYPSSKPKAIDHTCTKGPNEGRTVLGIYSVKGDLLKFAMPEDPSTRPSRFWTESDSAYHVAFFKRDKN